MTFLFLKLSSLTALLGKTSTIAAAGRETASSPLHGERYLRRLLWHLLGGTRGGPNRAEILRILHERPSNANQLAEALRVDYKTVQHHLRVLEENRLVSPSEKGAYGAVMLLTPKAEDALPILEEIWSKIGKRSIRSASVEGR